MRHTSPEEGQVVLLASGILRAQPSTNSASGSFWWEAAAQFMLQTAQGRMEITRQQVIGGCQKCLRNKPGKKTIAYDPGQNNATPRPSKEKSCYFGQTSPSPLPSCWTVIQNWLKEKYRFMKSSCFTFQQEKVKTAYWFVCVSIQHSQKQLFDFTKLSSVVCWVLQKMKEKNKQT